MAVDFNLRLRNTGIISQLVEREIVRVSNQEVRRRTQLLLQELRETTPVRTGRARDGWRITFQRRFLGEARVEVTNNVPYIPDLNMGTSRQAPARFIERAALRYFTPDGVIVNVRR